MLVEPDSRMVRTLVGDVSVEGARASDLVESTALLARNGLPQEGVAEAFDGFVVLRKDGDIVGVCGIEVHGEEGLLRSLAVRDDCRGAGLGRLLIEETRRRARYQGIRSLYLLTTTASEFFRHLGFVTSSRDSAPAAIRDSWEFRTGCPSSAVLMKAPA